MTLLVLVAGRVVPLPPTDNGAGVRGEGMKVQESLEVKSCRLNDSPVTDPARCYAAALTMAGHLALICEHSLRSFHNSRKEKKEKKAFFFLSDFHVFMR